MNNINTHVKSGYSGIKEWKPQSRITFINGINCTYERCRDIASILSTYHRYNKIHFIADETQGEFNDVIDAAELMLSQQNEAVEKLAQLWVNLFKEMDESNHPESKVITYAWSRGGLVTKLALEKLPQHLREKMIVYTFGTPAIIDSQGLKKVEQFSNNNDFVPYLNPARCLTSCFSYENDVNLDSQQERGLDHNIIGSTYLSEIKKIGQKYYSK